MKIQNLKKLSLIAVGLLIMSPHSFSKSDKYWAIRNGDLSSLGSKQRINFHTKITALAIELGALEKKPAYNGGSKFSYNEFLNDFSSLLIPYAHAGGGNCLFGGWVSARSGLCNRPYLEVGKAASSSAGTSQYDSKYHCKSTKLFRCNPLVFGPGINPRFIQGNAKYKNINGFDNNTAPYEKGLCVDISKGFDKPKSLSQKCNEARKEIDGLRQDETNLNSWRSKIFSDEEKNKEFKNLRGVIADLCEVGKASSMCDAINESLGVTLVATKTANLMPLKVSNIPSKCIEEGSIEDKSFCKTNPNESLEYLKEAIKLIKSKENCKFRRIEASLASDNDGDGQTCPSGMKTNLLTKGLKRNGTMIRIKAFDRNDEGTGELSLRVTPNMPKDAIYQSVVSHFNKRNFEKMCKKSALTTCNNPENKFVSGVISKNIEKLKNHTYRKKRKGKTRGVKKSCGITSFEVGVERSPPNRRNISFMKGIPINPEKSSYCSIQYKGDFKSFVDKDYGPKDVPSNIVVKSSIRITKGDWHITVPFDISVDGASGQSHKQIYDLVKDNEDFKEFCKYKVPDVDAGKEPKKSEKKKIAPIKTVKAPKTDGQIRWYNQRVNNIKDKFEIDKNTYLSREQVDNLYTIKDMNLTIKLDEFGRMIVKGRGIIMPIDRMNIAKALGRPSDTSTGNTIVIPSKDELLLLNKVKDLKDSFKEGDVDYYLRQIKKKKDKFKSKVNITNVRVHEGRLQVIMPLKKDK